MNQQIAIMRKSYNQQLNEISEKIILEFSSPIIKKNEIKKIKLTSIQEQCQDDLISNINQLINQEKKNYSQDPKIAYIESKNALFQKEIESKLEHLKHLDQLNFQESINILQDTQKDDRVQGLILLSKQIWESGKVNQEQLNIKNKLNDLINSSKQLYCQMGLFNQIIQKYQEHNSQVQNINNKMKSISDNMHLTNIQKQVLDYTKIFQNDLNISKNFVRQGNKKKFQTKCNKNTIDQNKKAIKLKKKIRR